jgi:hypothetical protein
MHERRPYVAHVSRGAFSLAIASFGTPDGAVLMLFYAIPGGGEVDAWDFMASILVLLVLCFVPLSLWNRNTLV